MDLIYLVLHATTPSSCDPQELLDACGQGNLEEVASLLKKGVNVEARDRVSETMCVLYSLYYL